METVTLQNDITVLCLEARSFPEGVREAHERLHVLVPPTRERSYFGLSRPARGAIRYCAAAELLHPAEAPQLGLQTVVLQKGRYLSAFLPDFMEHVAAIGDTFQRMLQEPGIDPEGWCVEWYGGDGRNVTCMVRLADDAG